MTSVSASRECRGWSAHLTRPVRVKNGPTLRTLDDLRAFILSEPKAVHGRKTWQCAWELLLAAAERDGDIGVVTEKIELALFLESRWLPAPPIVLVHPTRDDIASVERHLSGGRQDGQPASSARRATDHEIMKLLRALRLLQPINNHSRQLHPRNFDS
jgi:hypothetical protein